MTGKSLLCRHVVMLTSPSSNTFAPFVEDLARRTGAAIVFPDYYDKIA